MLMMSIEQSTANYDNDASREERGNNVRAMFRYEGEHLQQFDKNHLVYLEF
jgi:hypothetical protein